VVGRFVEFFGSGLDALSHGPRPAELELRVSTTGLLMREAKSASKR